MIKDMTNGSPSKILFYFALPMVVGNIFQQLYNIVDSIIVGNFVGINALAAVGASYPITFVLITVANGASIGCSVVISQLFGAKDITKMKSSIYTALLSVGILGLILMLLGLVFNENILRLLQIKDNILNDASAYMNIYFLGTIFLFIYNISTSSFNALGDSKTPLAFLIFSSIINVFLDLLLVGKFNMGVKGAAIATFIVQSISALLSLTFILKRVKSIQVIDMHERKIKIFDLEIFKCMCKISIPSTLQQSIVSIGNLLVQALVNSYGVVTIAGYTAATKIDSITILPMSNLSNAVSNFTAQNIGGKKIERVKSGYRSALIMIAIFSISVTILLFVFGQNLIELFINSDSNQDVIKIGTQYLRIVSVFYFFMGLMVTTNGVLRGSGDIKMFIISTISNLGSRVMFAYFFAYSIGEKGIWYAVPLGWIIASTISVVRYKSGKWKNKSIVS